MVAFWLRCGHPEMNSQVRAASTSYPPQVLSAQLVERGDLEVEPFISGAPTPVRGDGHAVDLTAIARNLDWPRSIFSCLSQL